MAKPKTKINEIVALIDKYGPVSPNRLTEITGDFRQSIDKYVREAHLAEFIHVAAFGQSPFGGNRTVKLYAAGKGIDAQRPGTAKKPAKAKKPVDEALRRCKKYSRAEKRIIREIKESGKSVKSQMHRLPGRTFWGVQFAVANLKGKKKSGLGSWVWASVLTVLRDEANISARDLSARIGCTSRQMRTVLNENRGRGVFISGWEMHCRTLSATWSLGDQADVQKPPLQTLEEKREKRRARDRRCGARKQVNPFSTALGLIRGPNVGTGRVYQQDMSERAAA